MTAITYSTDPTWAPRHVLALAAPDGLQVRTVPLSEVELLHPEFVHDARRKLGDLRAMLPVARLAEWVRWQGLSVVLEDVPDGDPAALFATPLPPRKQRAA